MSVLEHEYEHKYQPVFHGTWNTTTDNVEQGQHPYISAITGDSRSRRAKSGWRIVDSATLGSHSRIIASSHHFVPASKPVVTSNSDTTLENWLVTWINDLRSSTTGDPDPLADFCGYNQPNWDGYGANPITHATIAATRVVLNMLPSTFGNPHIAPGADGTIGFEWLLKTGPLVKLFIDIGPGFNWSAYWRRKDGEVGKYPLRQIDFFQTPAILAQLFKRLSV